MTLDPTATHLPVWDVLFSDHKIKDVLEFGCGLFSTQAFVARGCNVTSIEMQHREWFDKIKDAIPSVDIRLALGPQTWRDEPLKDRYDLIFVDGHGDSRPDCLMWAKDRADIIVAHDTEHDYYDWARADMSGFDVKLFDDLSPTTTVWTRKAA
jgi:hypothetical protein